MKIFSTILFLNLFLFFAPFGYTQTTHYRTADRVGNLTLASVNSGDEIRLKVSPGNSYCCEVQLASGNIRFANTTIDITNFSGATSVVGRLAGDDEPQLANKLSRICFVAPTTIADPTALIDIGSVVGVVNNVPVQCYETTLYGGFNTSVTNFNFLELINTLTKLETSDPKTVSGKITAINTVPNPDVTVINNVSFSVQPGSRLDVDIHQAAGIGAFGPVKVAHDAAPGALKGIVSQYNITSTSPFDFAPVLQDVLQTRANFAGARR